MFTVLDYLEITSCAILAIILSSLLPTQICFTKQSGFFAIKQTILCRSIQVVLSCSKLHNFLSFLPFYYSPVNLQSSLSPPTFLPKPSPLLFTLLGVFPQPHSLQLNPLLTIHRLPIILTFRNNSTVQPPQNNFILWSGKVNNTIPRLLRLVPRWTNNSMNIAPQQSTR